MYTLHVKCNIIDYLPFEDNENLTPVYKELKGWDKDLMNISSLNEAHRKFTIIFII